MRLTYIAAGAELATNEWRQVTTIDEAKAKKA
jgi:hypothetical protein